jgi:hypothetical protein
MAGKKARGLYAVIVFVMLVLTYAFGLFPVLSPFVFGFRGDEVSTLAALFILPAMVYLVLSVL